MLTGKSHLSAGTFWVDFLGAAPWFVAISVRLTNYAASSGVILVTLIRGFRIIRVGSISKSLMQGRYLMNHRGRFASAKALFTLSLVYCFLVMINFLVCMVYSIARCAAASRARTH